MYIESGDTVAVSSENSTKDAPYHTTYHQQQQQQGERGGGEIATHVPPGSIMMTTFHDRPMVGENNHTNIHKNHHSANGSCSDTDSDMDQNNNHNTGSHYNESHRTATTSSTKPPSNEQLLGVAFLTFFTFATVQMIFALHIAHSQAMMGDSAAMLVDAFTYLFNYIAERQKAAVQDQNRNDGNDGKDVPNSNSNYNNNNTDIVHDTDRNGRNNTVAAATLLLQKQAYEQQRQDRKMVLQLEIIPPVVSVTTLIIVTIVVVQKAVHILILDTHRSKAQQTIPNLRLMFLFSCFNLVLDFVNVMCFARAKHCCGYHTTVTTTTASPNTNQNHHCHQRQYCTNGDKISNNHNDDGDEENSAHSGTHLLDETITTDVRIVQTPQPQQHPSSNILQQVAHPMVATRGYSHVPNIDAVTKSCNGINQDNGCCMTSSVNGSNVTLPQNTAYENNTFVIHDKGENDDDDESHVIVEDYDRYVELLQHNHTRTTTNVDQIHNSDVDNETNQDHSNHNRHLHSEHDEEDDDTTNLNMCSAYTHVFADTLRSIAVIIAAIVAELVPQITPEVADSTAAILVSILILFSLVPLVQGLINSGRELQIIYREEKLDTMATMHATPITMDHFELT